MRYFAVFIVFLTIAGCGRSGRMPDHASESIPEEPEKDVVKDIDGNIYHPIRIGQQVWLAENLKVKRFRNGDPLPFANGSAQWRKGATPAVCAYENDPDVPVGYGLLYNWYAVTDPRNICPEGWRVPNDIDWRILVAGLGEDLVAGKKLNESGFRALYGGYRNIRGEFFSQGEYGFYWTSTEENETEAWSWFIQYDWQGITRIENHKNYGFSVRCIKE